LLSRLLKPRPDDHAAVRPLWHRVVEIAREKPWYTALGVVDSVPGRFDAVALVLVLVLLRMEREPALAALTGRITELFVTDMDGQLRQSGVGDLVVGKKIGKLMSVLGGRLGAYRDGLASADPAPLANAITRNMTLRPGTDPAPLAAAVRALAQTLEATPAEALLAGAIAR
jgi:cytochrome b pre-mRNA-processing protein 3